MENDDFGAMVAPLKQRMVNAIWRVVRDPDATEDVLQEVLTRLVARFDRIRRHPNPPALLIRTCTNAALDHVRRNHGKRRQTSLEGIAERPDLQGDVLDRTIEEETRTRIVAAISRLPRREAEAIALLALEELPYSEIARAMGCREATVRVLVMRARRRLKEELQTMGIGPEGSPS